ncbi:MAG: hypothetical protein E7643_06480 [Ruminococcaceae bacterium]|nr:hypothetical protein [Oscillospiraceae bacterium]
MRESLLILSEDAVFARMLELEFQMRMLSVRVMKQTAERVGIPVVLVDLDTSRIPETENGTQVIGFTRSDSVALADPDRHCSMILHRPFEIRRLTEEIQALILHTEKAERQETPTLCILDGRLFFGDASAELSPKECAVMRCLLSCRGEAVPRSKIADMIGDSGTNKPEVYICHLRKKLEGLTKSVTVRTVRGVGYRLEEN